MDVVASSSTLSGGSPRRLLHHAGKWVLEVVRQVSLGQDLIRPTTQRLTGQRAIASYFKNNPDKALLAKATQRLMQSDLGVESCSYNAEAGEWIANSSPPPRLDRPDSYLPPREPPTMETELGLLKAQVVFLTAVQEGLLTRLARLESRLGQGFIGEERRAPPPAREEQIPGAPDEMGESEYVGRAASEQDELPSSFESDASEATSEGQSVSHDATDGALGADEPEDAPADDGPLPPAEERPGAPPRELLGLPPIDELGKCIALLIGGEVSARSGEPLVINRATRDCYAAAILDDHEQTLGIILMDLKATVFLGGTLMMLPTTELEKQLAALAPAEDSIAAAAEICNALSGAINGAQPQHVRTGRLEKFAIETFSWATEPADRRDIEDSFGGRTAVLSRPVAVPSA